MTSQFALKKKKKADINLVSFVKVLLVGKKEKQNYFGVNIKTKKILSLLSSMGIRQEIKLVGFSKY